MNYLQQISIGKKWIRLITFLVAFFIALPFFSSACIPGDELWLYGCFLMLGGFGSPDSFDDDSDYVPCWNCYLDMRLRIYSNTDGLLIPESYAEISNQNTVKVSIDYYLNDGRWGEPFKSHNTPEALLPCWDFCECNQENMYGHTRCLEAGQTWQLQIEAFADGYASQTDTLTLDNQSDYIVVTFFLDPV